MLLFSENWPPMSCLSHAEHRRQLLWYDESPGPLTFSACPTVCWHLGHTEPPPSPANLLGGFFSSRLTRVTGVGADTSEKRSSSSFLDLVLVSALALETCSEAAEVWAWLASSLNFIWAMFSSASLMRLSCSSLALANSICFFFAASDSAWALALRAAAALAPSSCMRTWNASALADSSITRSCARAASAAARFFASSAPWALALDTIASHLAASSSAVAWSISPVSLTYAAGNTPSDPSLRLPRHQSWDICFSTMTSSPSLKLKSPALSPLKSNSATACRRAHKPGEPR
jgi:hypothetical protein